MCLSRKRIWAVRKMSVTQALRYFNARVRWRLFLYNIHFYIIFAVGGQMSQYHLITIVYSISHSSRLCFRYCELDIFLLPVLEWKATNHDFSHAGITMVIIVGVVLRHHSYIYFFSLIRLDTQSILLLCTPFYPINEWFPNEVVKATVAQ